MIGGDVVVVGVFIGFVVICVVLVYGVDWCCVVGGGVCVFGFFVVIDGGLVKLCSCLNVCVL